MLAYNLSPSFNWDTTGHERRADARASPRSSGSWGSSSTSSPTAATRSTASPARSSPPRCARTACSRSPGCSGSSACSSRRTARRRRSSAARAPTPALMALSGRTVDHQGDGQGLDAVPAPGADRGAAQAARGVARPLAQAARHRRQAPGRAQAAQRRARSCSSSRCSSTDGAKAANVVFDTIQDRRGRSILSVRDQNTFDVALRRKRLMTLAAALPHAPLQDRLGALPHADRGQPPPDRGHEGAAASSAPSTTRSARSSSPT